MPLLSGGSNAAHHPPRSPMEIDDSVRVRGRVHALVRAATDVEITRSARRTRHATAIAARGTKPRPFHYTQLFSAVRTRPANPLASSYVRERPNAGIERARAAALNLIFRKIDEKHAIPRSARMTCSARFPIRVNCCKRSLGFSLVHYIKGRFRRTPEM